MKKFSKLVAVMGFVLALGAGMGVAKAATVAEQIVSAIAKNDFKTVQQLTTGNPGQSGFAAGELLSFIRSNLVLNPDASVGAMTLAASLGGSIGPEDAKGVADKLKGIVTEIADKALLICNPEGDDQQKKTDVTLSPEKQALAEAMQALMLGAENLAGQPVIVAVDPRLLEQIKAQNAQCQEGGDAQLAQRPSFSPQHQPPHIIPPPRPPKKEEPSAE